MKCCSYPDWYRKVSAPFRGPAASRALDVLDRGLVIVIAVAYVAVLAKLALSTDMRLFKALLVPAFTFALVTVVRSALDRPRPYALHDINPILVKDRLGKSFPSRHVSSAVAIACALGWLEPAWALPAAAACCIVCATRILGGVHFPRDVAAAVVISLACAYAGYILLP